MLSPGPCTRLGHINVDRPAIPELIMFFHSIEPGLNPAVRRIHERCDVSEGPARRHVLQASCSWKPALRRVDHLVAKIDGHVEVGRIPFTDTKIPAQAD